MFTQTTEHMFNESMREHQALTSNVWRGTFNCSSYMLAVQTVDSAQTKSTADKAVLNDPSQTVNYTLSLSDRPPDNRKLLPRKARLKHTLRVSLGMFAFQLQLQITSPAAQA